MNLLHPFREGNGRVQRFFSLKRCCLCLVMISTGRSLPSNNG
ncbi:Fic family protein [Vibrio sinaloensis]|nr:Fic family protein [Vibrio sinaloensis]